MHHLHRELPITAKRDDIVAGLRDHQVVVVCGETGSGKTTQLPKICLATGRGTSGLIGHTQPRRIAARSVAARIAEELNSPLGEHVGYKIRFTDTLTTRASIKIMTDGILLAETRSDSLLRAYDTIILDEAHERSLNIDFLLGYLKRILPRRRDLKLIITSATIDPQRFSEHFGGPRRAPIIEVSGRGFPIETRYRPLASEESDRKDRDLYQGVIDAVAEACSSGPGDILVFLPGERDIRELAKALEGRTAGTAEALPLYARLTSEEQNRMFRPHAHRRIVLATNVAETSLTVPGIRYVIDSGLARISRYSARSGVQRLPIEPISRASAEQRKGRCGRVGPGVCIRLYSEEELESRDAFTPPEILRTNLASVILQMKALKLGRVEDFPFVESPRMVMITDGYSTLHELGAIDEWGEITPLGRKLAHLPVDPRLGRMILAAREEGCVNDALVIAAALSIQDPRERPRGEPQRQNATEEAHAEFRDDRSDFVTLLNLWRFFQEKSRELSQSRLRKLCRDRYLAYARMREWIDVHHQLREMIAESEVTAHWKHARKRKRGKPRDEYDGLHRAILAGLLSRMGVKGDAHEYTGAFGRKFHIFPGSGVFKQSPEWIVASELVETTKLYAHNVAAISPKWIEKIASHLVKRRHAEPHWRQRSQDVGALETVTLFGLEIVRNRRVSYGTIDASTSREVFIRNALVEQKLRTNAPFFAHNRALIESINDIENKTRTRGLLDDERIFTFYDQRIPLGIFSGRAFEAWRRKAENDDPQLLYLDRHSLQVNAALSASSEQFPDYLLVKSARLPLKYRFEPGHERDGVTLTVPAAILPQVSSERLQWLVPGMLEEKITALIKALPKSTRREFPPGSIPSLAAKCAERCAFARGVLTEAIAQTLHAMLGVAIPPDAWKLSELPAHLRMNARIIADDERVIAQGRDFDALRNAARSSSAPQCAPAQSTRTTSLPSGRFTHWTFGDLPESIVLKTGNIDLTAYPAIVDEIDAVSIQPLQTAALAQGATRRGLRRLIALAHPQEMRELRHELPHIESMAIHYAALNLGSGEQLRSELLDAVLDRAFLDSVNEPIRAKDTFDRIVSGGWHRTADAIVEVCEAVKQTLSAAIAARAMLDGLATPKLESAAREIESHLNRLLAPGFICSTPVDQLVHFPRYIEAVRLRITKLTTGKFARDRDLAAEFEPLWRRCTDLLNAQPEEGWTDDRLEGHRWLLEELRVAMFAQELGTAVRVSIKRIEEHWRECETVRR